MALIKFGAGISEMRGKEGGVIYSRNAYGAYQKAKVSPTNPQTGAQQLQRSLMAQASQKWAGITPAEKASWDNLGAQATRVNRFGDITSYTGFGMFMYCNRNVALTGEPMIDAAPTMPEIPELEFTTFVPDSAGPEMVLGFSPTPVPTGYVLMVYATNNILTGRRFVKNYYRLISVQAAAVATGVDVHADWLAYFVNAMLAGARISCKVRLQHKASGFHGVDQELSAVVA